MTAKDARQMAIELAGPNRLETDTNLFDPAAPANPPVSSDPLGSPMIVDTAPPAEASEQKESQVRAFYELLTSVNQVSNRAPTYLESCTALGLELTTPGFLTVAYSLVKVKARKRRRPPLRSRALSLTSHWHYVADRDTEIPPKWCSSRLRYGSW